MNNCLNTLLLCLLLVSCSAEKTDDDTAVFFANQTQLTGVDNYGEGEETLYRLKEMASDKSVPDAQQGVQKLIVPVSKVDHATEACYVVLENLKLDLLREIGEEAMANTTVEKENHRPYAAARPLFPSYYDLFSVDYLGNTDFLAANSAEYKRLRKAIEECRHMITTILAERTDETDNYSFLDPQLHGFKNEQDLMRQLDKAIGKSRIAPDDEEALKQIYRKLSMTDEKWERMFPGNASWITVFHLLTQWQNTILKARGMAVRTIGSRITSCGYPFDKILPLTTGNGLATAGEPLEFEVFMAAYDSWKQPLVTCEHARIVKTAGGKATVQVIPVLRGEQVLKGTITIFNKSGIPKTLPWEKRITVLPAP